MGRHTELLSRRFLASLAVIVIPLLTFELGLIWAGTWGGSSLRDMFSQMILFGFGAEIGLSVSPDVRKKKLTFMEVLGFCVYPFLVATLPFIPSYSHGLSIGVTLATMADATYKGIYAADRFLPRLLTIHTRSSAQKPSPHPKESVVAYDGLLPLLEPFIWRWEAKEVLGKEPSRWLGVETEDRMDLQESARTVSDQLLQLSSKYSDEWDIWFKNQVGYVSEELRKFGVVQPTATRKGLDFTAMDSHGRNAFEAAKAIVGRLKLARAKQ